MSFRLLHLCSGTEYSKPLSRILEPAHSLTVTHTLADTRTALARDSDWQMLLIDIQMVQQLGEGTCEQLISSTRSLHIQCALTGTSNIPTDQLLALRLGCLGDLAMPYITSLVTAKLDTWSTISQSFRQEQQRKQELQQIQQAAILCMAHITRLRDHSTGNHTLRCQHFVRVLAEKLRSHPDFSGELIDSHTIELLSQSAALHDIGKVGIADNILQKPGSLNAAEYETMKQHTWHGYQALADAEKLLPEHTHISTETFIRFGKQITLSHHERWDGKGYPQQLKGTQIPISARLMAVADVYDAVTSERPYQPERSHQVAVSIIQHGRGNQFDPNVVDAFLALTGLFSQTNQLLQARFPSHEAQHQLSTDALH